MHEALLIARREYVERIRSRAFRVSTVLIPVAFAFIFGIGSLTGKLAGGAKHIVIASNDAVLAESERAELMDVRSGARQSVEVRAPVTESELAPLNAEVESKRIDGYLWLKVTPGTRELEATYASRGSADFVGKDRMRDSIGHAMVRAELLKRGATGEEINALLKDVDLKTLRLTNGRSEGADASKGFLGAYLMAFLLYFAVVFYGVNVAHSVVAEKTSRVFEVLLASARPESLMLGKLLGVGAVGLTQMAIWIFFILLFSLLAFYGHGVRWAGRVWSDSAATDFLCALFCAGIFLLQRIERRPGRDCEPGV